MDCTIFFIGFAGLGNFLPSSNKAVKIYAVTIITEYKTKTFHFLFFTMGITSIKINNIYTAVQSIIIINHQLLLVFVVRRCFLYLLLSALQHLYF